MATADRDDPVRYARHLNLAGVGPEGQSRLAAGEATVRSRDLAGFVARRYL
ncbi:MAG: adenylyltransferase, partial [Myxococcales bacterium]